MNKLNEKQIIKIFQKNFRKKKFVSEDVEFFKIGKTMVVVKVDTFVQSTDMPKMMNVNDAARKSIVATVSDFASKGVKPLYGIISVTLPNNFSESDIRKCARGITKAENEFKIKILGGDTNQGRELVIQISLFGIAKKIIPRNGAKKNDLIISTGPFGYSAAGLQIIKNKKKAKTNFSRKAKRAFLRPTPPLKFNLTNCKYFSSSMDSSDGLSSTLLEMARQSKKKFVITELPTKQEVIKFAKDNQIDQLDLIFNGGEEYETIATVSPMYLEKIKSYTQKQKSSLFVIGYVTNGKGVMYQKNGKIVKIENKGWLHFNK